MTEPNTRIKQILSVLEKEDILLQDVTKRLFNQSELSPTWLHKTLNTPEGIDRLESFTSKFSRMQDTFTDKLLPLFLRLFGEVPATAIDNLHRLEQLKLINHADAWVELRLLRNKLVHEYVDNTEELFNHLVLAKELSLELHDSFHKIKLKIHKSVAK
ncbi:MAG: hypothetical protein KAI83_08990 [Thiomargarita sp.]|nr:hypothetical protein [Thiomargarita sp.]